MIVEIEPARHGHPGTDSGIDLVRSGLADTFGQLTGPGAGCDWFGGPPLVAVRRGGADGDVLTHRYTVHGWVTTEEMR